MYFLVCVLIKITILVEIPSRPGQRELPIGPPIRLRLTHAGFDPPLASPQQDVSSMSPEHIWHWSLPLHHGMSKDRYSAGYQQPSAPLAGASLENHLSLVTAATPKGFHRSLATRKASTIHRSQAPRRWDYSARHRHHLLVKVKKVCQMNTAI